MRGRPGLALNGVATLLMLGRVFFPAAMRAPVRAAEPATSDGRQLLRLLPVERDAVRAEMRQMLASIAGVVRAVSERDSAGVEKAARASG